MDGERARADCVLDCLLAMNFDHDWWRSQVPTYPAAGGGGGGGGADAEAEDDAEMVEEADD